MTSTTKAFSDENNLKSVSCAAAIDIIELHSAVKPMGCVCEENRHKQPELTEHHSAIQGWKQYQIRMVVGVSVSEMQRE